MVTSQPPYRLPSFDELTARVPRLVNTAWLIRALRDNAKASDKGMFLPWNDGDLLRRAATRLEQLERAR